MAKRAWIVGVGLGVMGLAAQGRAEGLSEGLAKALTFAATFDTGVDADVAKGDRRLWSAAAMDKKGAEPGLGGAKVERVAEGGRSGGALQFDGGNTRALFYRAEGNVAYRGPGASEEGWSGTLSYWLSLDPEQDLPPNYVDPLQITDKAWNDAAIWNDFTKDDRPRKFRLGVLADLKVWNPDGKDFDKMPDAEKPAVVVNNPPFARGKWTHVAIVFERFNTGKADGTATLYLDGKAVGSVTGRDQRYSWDAKQAVMFLGIGYAGLMDDVMMFDRALTEAEVGEVWKVGREGGRLVGR